MAQTILLTAAKEDSQEILSLLDEQSVLHAPLEVYVTRTDDGAISDALGSLQDFENIVHSNIRNAAFFLEQVDRFEKWDAVKNRLNLTFDEATFNYLESRNIPAIHPPNGNKPIDLVELMLRLQRLGSTLYPCGAHQREDFPGFLKELDMEVKELDVFDLEGPGDEALNNYQQQVETTPPQTVIFHSRRSVNRTLAAFNDLDYRKLTVISADKGITNKLEEKEIEVDKEAQGNWESIAELI